MKRVKIFTVRDDPGKAEAAVNHWLEKNPDVEIVDLAPAQSREGDNGLRYTLAVFYDDTVAAAGDVYKVKRDHERRELFEIVDYAVEGRLYRDFIQDVSASGLFIRTGRQFAVGQEVAMTFMSPGQGESFRITGEIVRTLPQGIGVRFRKESQVQDELIRAYIQNLK